jgi:signal transduction histidine kinase
LGIGGIYNPLGVEGLPNIWELIQRLLFALMFISVVSLFVRQLRTSGVERQQLKWFTYAATLSIGGIILTYIISEAIGSMWLGRAGQVILIVGALGTPIAMGIAILRYRLYDIDLVINRTLVYGTLTASVVGIYVLVVGYLGTLFQMDDLFVSLLTTGLVAVLFAPLRDRLQRGVNRLMYGERDDPYAVVSRLGERLEATLAPDDVLLTIVKTVREELKLPYAAIALPRDGTGFEVVATSGEEPPADPLVLLLSYGGEQVGELLLAPRAPGESFSTADRRLLDGLAHQAGVAVHGVRVMADLRRSRERLVLAREEERRRLRRDLHDELAPTLAALGLSAATVGELILTEPKEAAFANEKLRAAIRATVGDVRRLVYELRPPALDELGLIEAIRERASRYGGVGDEGFRAMVEAPDEFPPLPAAVEVAAYRIVQEALMNVSRHARATACTIRLACTESPSRALTIEVTDDGVGLPERPEHGIGLSSMRERAAELGGECKIVRTWPSGTRVFAQLPFREPLLEERKEEE